MVLDGNNGGAVWLGGGGEREENEEGSWGRNQEDGSEFKPMLESDWFSNPPPHPQDLQMLHNQQDFRFLFPFNPNDNLLLQHSIDSSSSCSESSFLGQIHAPMSMGFGSLTQLGNRDLSYVPDFLSAREENRAIQVKSEFWGFNNFIEREVSLKEVERGSKEDEEIGVIKKLKFLRQKQ